METRVWRHVPLVSKRVSLKTQGMFLVVVVPVADMGAVLQESKRSGHLHSHRPKQTALGETIRTRQEFRAIATANLTVSAHNFREGLTLIARERCSEGGREGSLGSPLAPRILLRRPRERVHG